MECGCPEILLLAMQVSNWNAGRGYETSYREAMNRLAEESGDIWKYSLEASAEIKSSIVDVQAAIVVLETCQTGEAADAIVDLGLNTIRSGSGGFAKSDALSLLVTNERLLERQSPKVRTLLREYAQTLEGISDTSEFIRPTIEIGEIDKHPFVGFTAKLDPSETPNGVDVRRVRTVRPLNEVCKDPTFLKMFYRWERATVFELRLQDWIVETVKESTQALGLTINIPESEEEPGL